MQSWQMAGPQGWEQRFRPMVTVVPYVLLAVMAALTIAFKHDQPGSLAVDLVLYAAAAVWSLALFTLRPAWRDRIGVMGVFLAGLILFGLVMVLRDPWFGLYTPALYFYAYRIIGWPRELYFIAGVAVVAGTAQSAGLDTGSWAGRLEYLGILGVNIAPMCLLAWMGEIGARYYDSREAALREAREANARLAAALAENAALQERLVEQARAAGVLDERARMAREIHDTLAQGLTGIVTQLQAAEHAADDPAAWRRHHAAATALARESLTEARRSVNELRPEPLETGRLADAITEVAAAWSARHSIPAQVTVTGEVRTMRPEAEVVLLRVAQEASANVAKHAGTATRVGLTLSYMDRQVALDVRDDGRGFDPASRIERDGGFGLVAMRQRIEALSGTLQIESEVGDGTGISACLPGEAADGAEAVRLAETLEPDVILMDLRMAGMDGVTAIGELTRRGVSARVLVLTTYDTDSHVLPAIEAGATGYRLKDAPRDELLRAVRSAARGEVTLSPSVAARLMSQLRAPAPSTGPLSPRELEVLRLVATGHTNREAAARLFITEATVAEGYNRGLLGAPEPP